MKIGMRVRCALWGLAGLLVLLAGAEARAQGLPKIAVTDLTYEEKVASFFRYAEATERAGKTNDGFGRDGFRERSMVAASGEIVRIERGELHKFTGDIKGALLKSGSYLVVQGHPWTQPETATIYDVIERIKNNHFPGADYVLFGTITSIESRNEAIPIQATNAVNLMLSMELLAEFSLINTKTYEVVAAFSAMGEGSDARLVNTPGAVIQLSRGRVMRDVSHSLSDAALSELGHQFGPTAKTGLGDTGGQGGTDGGSGGGKAIIYH